ncbi:hotdog domain-containing protein [Tsukamurella sp. 8F]|uniref:acyl-CoA thioesterase n=1 Tax=unclassified Tsukamurella TaxID=2633480 RepID=UPI0023B96AB3|nr:MULTISPECIES: hotdog domain-containing protein [unclassified Tsukamurella]MDF0532163.1 hotdog domain-containing protein [Tsukamurella sp. 8J]MDF0589447.1 hotdog domain-containing protein [Tsukamurella sp. 8F]
MDDRRITLRFMAAPTDVASLGGGVRGGRILEWIDKAAYACAAAWSGGYSVTAYVGNISFGRDIESGDLVEVTATLVYTGRTSMHIECEVASADPRLGRFTGAGSCLLVFVAVGDDGRPTRVRQWQPVRPDDVERAEDAARRVVVRRRISECMATVSYTEATEAERMVTRFLAAPTDVNWGGKAHGGRVMSWMDDAAYLTGVRWSGGEVASVYVGGVRFYRPIHIGHVVQVEARLIHTGRQTMHVSVHLRSGWPQEPDPPVAAHCLTVLAALDSAGDAVAVRQWRPLLDEDITLDVHARDLVAIRGERTFRWSAAEPHA